MSHPLLSVIVACTIPDGVIGYQNTLPWHLKTDLQRFKRITFNHAIIMGRNTYQSIGKPLPKRLNIVVSNTLQKENDLIITPSFDEAIKRAQAYANEHQQTEIFLIGGAQLFNHAFTLNLVDKVYLTQVHLNIQGDTFFRHSLATPNWICQEKEEIPATPNVDDAPTSFSIWKKHCSY